MQPKTVHRMFRGTRKVKILLAFASDVEAQNIHSRNAGVQDQSKLMSCHSPLVTFAQKRYVVRGMRSRLTLM